jgi:hypothetical protein
MLVAVAALAFAMVGTAVAGPSSVSKLTKSKVKSISKKQADKELKANVAGSHVNTADKATSADSASNAGAVNGQTILKVNYRADAGTGAQSIFSAGGLSISGACAAGNNISLNATTTKQDSSIYSFVGSDATPGDPTEADLEGGGFDVGSNFNLLAGGNGNINFIHFEFDALDGTIATGTLAVDENGIANGCLATGNVVIG